MPSVQVKSHPWDKYLKQDRLPHIWCAGCGVGSVLSTFISAYEQSGLDWKKLAVVSGIGCTGRVAGYMNTDSFHTTHGRPIPFAFGLKLARPDLNVVVFSGDGDLVTIGGNHFIHAARRNADMLVIMVNNYNYGMTGGQAGATTPEYSQTTTTPYGNPEHPFIIPALAMGSGAVYVARWTTLHLRRLLWSIKKALKMKGFRIIEVLSQCPTAYGRRNQMSDPIKELEHYRKYAIIKNDANWDELEIKIDQKIILGEFVDKSEEKEPFEQLYEEIVYSKARKKKA